MVVPQAVSIMMLVKLLAFSPPLLLIAVSKEPGLGSDGEETSSVCFAGLL